MSKTPSTRSLLLDEAERLFAEKGVKGTTIRELSRAAGVNVAAVNYYFGSKKGLVRAVLTRRLRPINARRQEKLEALLWNYKRQGERPPVAEVVKAFAAPAFEALGEDDPKARYFLTFLGRAIMEPDPQVRDLFLEEMESVVRLLWQALKVALPHLPEERLFWRMQFFLGAMVRALSWPTKKSTWPWDFEEGKISRINVLEEFVSFVTPGLEAKDVSS